MQVSETVSCENLQHKNDFLYLTAHQSDQVLALEMEKLKACGLDEIRCEILLRIDALLSSQEND
jgi:hypothetical protein